MYVAAHVIPAEDVRWKGIYAQRFNSHQIRFRNRDAVWIKKLTQTIVIQLLPKRFLEFSQCERLHHYPSRAGDFPVTHQLRHADLERQCLQLFLWDAFPIEERPCRNLQGWAKMIAVIKVEVESQRQGSVLTFHRLSFESEGWKFPSKGVEFGLIVSSFQNKRVFMPQNYELCPEYRSKNLFLHYGFRRKVCHTQQLVGAEAR